MLLRTILLSGLTLLTAFGCTWQQVEWREFHSEGKTLTVSTPSTVDTLEAVTFLGIAGPGKREGVEAYSTSSLQEHYSIGYVEPRRVVWQGRFLTSLFQSELKKPETLRVFADNASRLSLDLTCKLKEEKQARWQNEPVLIKTGTCQGTRSEIEVRVSPRGNVILFAVAKTPDLATRERFFKSVQFVPPPSALKVEPTAQEELERQGKTFFDQMTGEIGKALEGVAPAQQQ